MIIASTIIAAACTAALLRMVSRCPARRRISAVARAHRTTATPIDHPSYHHLLASTSEVLLHTPVRRPYLLLAAGSPSCREVVECSCLYAGNRISPKFPIEIYKMYQLVYQILFASWKFQLS